MTFGVGNTAGLDEAEGDSWLSSTLVFLHFALPFRVSCFFFRFVLQGPGMARKDEQCFENGRFAMALTRVPSLRVTARWSRIAVALSVRFTILKFMNKVKGMNTHYILQ